ncbi:hypothetical protein [Maribellus sediminis]|uniref:hypothetical protein n=1 Tax=Maribellus sediminis TaxID=2696285 RepID=UPI001430C88E|nr:hypothetical protein [Maribellus sediminis]
MKSFIVILFLIVLAKTIYAQPKGYIVAGNDTTNVILSVKKKHQEYTVNFRRLHDVQMNSLTAPNANEVFVPGQWKYVSVKLDSLGNNVWAKCIFEGEYSLLEYRSEYYIVTATEVFHLPAPDDKNNRNKYSGIMTMLFFSKIDYNYRSLDYSAKSLVEPLIIYHKKNNLPYFDYNSYLTVSSSNFVEANLGTTQGFYLADLNKYSFDGQSLGLAFNKTFLFPDWSKKLGLSTGVTLNVVFFDEYAKTTLVNGNAYADFKNTLYSAGIVGAIDFYVVDNAKLTVMFEAGVEYARLFASDTEVRIEQERGNIVNTAVRPASLNQNYLISQFDRLIIGVPKLNESILVGLGAKFPLGTNSEEANEFGVGQSLWLSVFYKF